MSERPSVYLKINNTGGSPGSSVFDLPVTNSNFVSQPKLLAPSAIPASNDTISFVVISGGTGGNSICSAFGNACYVLPVSDDGGSSSEIIRVLGGPSIGILSFALISIRSLIPSVR